LLNVSGLCEVEAGQSNIILDIEESRGNGKWNMFNYLNLSYIKYFY